MNIRSLYVHFPFCESKCHYCDFYSLGREKTKQDDPTKFEIALRKEAELRAADLNPCLDTVFFGGGTPSMTAFDSMSRALEPLWKFTSINEDTEWTMEANPSSIELNAFRSFRKYGVNRISMGVQALRPDLLKSMGRVHSREQALSALDIIFSAGFDNVSVDLLCGIPNQSLRDIEEALQILTRFPISHLSCYLLTLPKQHAMYAQLPDEDAQLSHLLFIHDWMVSQGFEHYEISNFAKPNKRARHNLRYWQGKSYLGLGPSAHSYCATAKKRWKNVSSLHRYAAALQTGDLPIDWTEELTSEQLHLEKWMLALRLDEGFPQDWLTTSLQKERAQIFAAKGLLEAHPSHPSHLRLTPRGFALSDQVIQSLA